MSGVRKIRRMFGKNHSNSKHSSEDGDVDESTSPVMSTNAAALPQSAGNSTTSSGRHHHPHTSPGLQLLPVTFDPPTPTVDLEPLLAELKERKDEASRLQEEMEAMKTQLQNECSLLHQSLQEERYRFEVRLPTHSCHCLRDSRLMPHFLLS